MKSKDMSVGVFDEKKGQKGLFGLACQSEREACELCLSRLPWSDIPMREKVGILNTTSSDMEGDS